MDICSKKDVDGLSKSGTVYMEKTTQEYGNWKALVHPGKRVGIQLF